MRPNPYVWPIRRLGRRPTSSSDQEGVKPLSHRPRLCLQRKTNARVSNTSRRGRPRDRRRIRAAIAPNNFEEASRASGRQPMRVITLVARHVNFNRLRRLRLDKDCSRSMSSRDTLPASAPEQRPLYIAVFLDRSGPAPDAFKARFTPSSGEGAGLSNHRRRLYAGVISPGLAIRPRQCRLADGASEGLTQPAPSVTSATVIRQPMYLAMRGRQRRDQELRRGEVRRDLQAGLGGRAPAMTKSGASWISSSSRRS